MDASRFPQSAELTVITPMFPPSKHLLDSAATTIGRAAECTIPVRDRYLSRKHAEIHASNGGWILKDCGSANGTFVNGDRVVKERPLNSGDRIRIGDTELVFQSEAATDRFLAVGEARVTPSISIPVREIDQPAGGLSQTSVNRLQVLNSLARELIGDCPLDELFGFMVDKVMEHLHPSRAAIALLSESGQSFVSVEIRREDENDTTELEISRTLLQEVVEERRALAFLDVKDDERLSRAKSIIMQGIHSVICAPILIGDSVVGVLYVDYRYTQRALSEEDVRLVAQIGKFAAIKLENTRLREDAIQKRLMDEELKTAYVIQRRLLPEVPPVVPGYSLAGLNRPCRTVSGDYYDFVTRPDGTIYFTIADVSGKGVTAALLMAGLQAAFRIFCKSDPTPAKLVEQLNMTLKENLPQSKFVTLFAGRLHPEDGRIEYTNAGHTPPLIIRHDRIEELSVTDLILGMFPRAIYHDQVVKMEPGDVIVLFTDGISEAQDLQGEEFSTDRVRTHLAGAHATDANAIAESVEMAVHEFCHSSQMTDDVTMLVLARNGAGVGR